MEVLSYRVRFGSSLRSVGECSPEHAQTPPLTVGGGGSGMRKKRTFVQTAMYIGIVV